MQSPMFTKRAFLKTYVQMKNGIPFEYPGCWKLGLTISQKHFNPLYSFDIVKENQSGDRL
jgi:hypothetical protein